eukprot:5114011-Prymnesium_polylepis.2
MASARMPVLVWVLPLGAASFGCALRGSTSENTSDVNLTAGLLSNVAAGKFGRELGDLLGDSYGGFDDDFGFDDGDLPPPRPVPQQDSQGLLDQAKWQLYGLLLYGGQDVWSSEPTLFLSTNTADSWFASVNSILLGARELWEQVAGPIVAVNRGLSGAKTSGRAGSVNGTVGGMVKKMAAVDGLDPARLVLLADDGHR